MKSIKRIDWYKSVDFNHFVTSCGGNKTARFNEEQPRAL